MTALLLRPLCLVISMLLPCSTGWAQSLQAQGQLVFKTRCVVCHGENADGQSDLARIMRPPPANLRASTLNDEDRARIVRKGGAAVGRSGNMPIWELELSDSELRAVVAYVGTLKVHP